MQEARDLALMLDGGRHAYDVASLADEEIAGEGYDVTDEVQKQHSAQADVVVHKADNCPGNQPPTLKAGQQKAVGLYEFLTWREFLDQGGHGGPEHPEPGSDQDAH